MIHSDEHDACVREMRERERRGRLIEKAYWKARPPWQKLRYWVLGGFLMFMALDYLSNGQAMRTLGFFSAGNCRDINHVSGGCW